MPCPNAHGGNDGLLQLQQMQPLTRLNWNQISNFVLNWNLLIAEKTKCDRLKTLCQGRWIEFLIWGGRGNIYNTIIVIYWHYCMPLTLQNLFYSNTRIKSLGTVNLSLESVFNVPCGLTDHLTANYLHINKGYVMLEYKLISKVL